MHSKQTVGIHWTPAPERPSIIPLRPSTPSSSERRQVVTNRFRGEVEDLLPASRTEESASMNRLPRYDSKTRRFEFSVFLGLGVLALALIGFTVRDSGRFAQNRDAIVDALTTAPVAPTELAGSLTNHAATNLSGVPTAARSDRAS